MQEKRKLVQLVQLQQQEVEALKQVCKGWSKKCDNLLRSNFYIQFFLDAFTHLYKRVCPSVRLWVRGFIGPWVRDAFFSMSRFWEKMVGIDWENSLIASNFSQSLPNFLKMSQNVPECPKISKNVQKCPLQTRRCPNGLV